MGDSEKRSVHGESVHLNERWKLPEPQPGDQRYAEHRKHIVTNFQPDSMLKIISEGVLNFLVVLYQHYQP